MNILKSSLLVVALTTLGGAAAVSAQEETQFPQSTSISTLTREEVRADLQAWRDAGLGELTLGEQTADTHSAEYQRRLAHY